jgi:hypothetical protein
VNGFASVTCGISAWPSALPRFPSGVLLIDDVDVPASAYEG